MFLCWTLPVRLHLVAHAGVITQSCICPHIHCNRSVTAQELTQANRQDKSCIWIYWLYQKWHSFAHDFFGIFWVWEISEFSNDHFFPPLNRKGIFYYSFFFFSFSNDSILSVFSERQRNSTVPSLHFQFLYCHALVNQLSLLHCAERTFLYLQCRSCHLFS